MPRGHMNGHVKIEIGQVVKVHGQSGGKSINLGICIAYAPPARWHSPSQGRVNVVGDDSAIDRYVVMYSSFAVTHKMP